MIPAMRIKHGKAAPRATASSDVQVDLERTSGLTVNHINKVKIFMLSPSHYIKYTPSQNYLLLYCIRKL